MFSTALQCISFARHLCAAQSFAQAWQPDGEGWLATGSKDGRLYIYDVDNGVPIGKGMPFICHPGAVAAPDGE